MSGHPSSVMVRYFLHFFLTLFSTFGHSYQKSWDSELTQIGQYKSKIQLSWSKQAKSTTFKNVINYKGPSRFNHLHPLTPSRFSLLYIYYLYYFTFSSQSQSGCEVAHQQWPTHLHSRHRGLAKQRCIGRRDLHSDSAYCRPPHSLPTLQFFNI